MRPCAEMTNTTSVKGKRNPSRSLKCFGEYFIFIFLQKINWSCALFITQQGLG
uniref:Uncharacterized protein n=1 Tax=Anguilla anguilla TaxID=7936 RepID=A0A0E9QKG0_ANGAN